MTPIHVRRSSQDQQSYQAEHECVKEPRWDYKNGFPEPQIWEGQQMLITIALYIFLNTVIGKLYNVVYEGSSFLFTLAAGVIYKSVFA